MLKGTKNPPASNICPRKVNVICFFSWSDSTPRSGQVLTTPCDIRTWMIFMTKMLLSWNNVGLHLGSYPVTYCASGCEMFDEHWWTRFLDGPTIPTYMADDFGCGPFTAGQRSKDEPVAEGHVDWSFDEETGPDGLQWLGARVGRGDVRTTCCSHTTCQNKKWRKRIEENSWTFG